MKAVLISTYDLGHQPFGLASPAAWLGKQGVEVVCNDLAVEEFNKKAVQEADVITFYLPMHTATRISADVIRKTRELNRTARLFAYGLYAPMNEQYLRELGVDKVLGGEFEEDLARFVADTKEIDPIATRRIPKIKFLVPDRSKLPALNHYAFLTLPNGVRRKVGYTEGSRGCKHMCRHCPIVPVYQGQFRIVQHEVVVADIEQLVDQGAEHITFGDPDFFNGPKHAVAVVQELHKRFPGLSYDVTIKIEHLLKCAALLPILKDTGCAFVTSAVESVDDRILSILDKGHTRRDFFNVVELFNRYDLTLAPTFVAFTPWIAQEGYRDLLACIATLDLIENVAPVQLGIRLLIPEGSRLLELGEVQSVIGPFDRAALCYRWRHPDPGMDRLQHEVEATVKRAAADGQNRRAVFGEIWAVLERNIGRSLERRFEGAGCCSSKPVPQLSEAWYCCAEPMEEQMHAF